MKNKIAIFVVFVLAAVLLIGCTTTPATSDKPIEIKVAHYMPPTGHLQKMAEQLGSYVEKETNNRVKFSYFPASTLVGPMEAYKGTVEGVCDFYHIYPPAYGAGRFPLTDVTNLPPGIPSGKVASKVYWDFFLKHKEIMDEWKEVKVLNVFQQPAMIIHTAKKPVRSLTDMKDLRLRVGITFGIKEMGAVPVGMPMSEAYVAMEKGICDGVVCPWSEMQQVKLADVCKYHTVVNIYNATFVEMMNLDKYNSLPSDVKKVFDSLDRFVETFGDDWDKTDQSAMQWTIDQGGHEVIEISENELAEWNKALTSGNEPWAAELEAKGLPGKKMLQDRDKALERYLK